MMEIRWWHQFRASLLMQFEHWHLTRFPYCIGNDTFVRRSQRVADHRYLTAVLLTCRCHTARVCCSYYRKSCLFQCDSTNVGQFWITGDNDLHSNTESYCRISIKRPLVT